MPDTIRSLFRCHRCFLRDAQPRARRSKAQEAAVVIDDPQIAIAEAYDMAAILVFGEADDVKDVSLRLQTALRDGTDLFVGFRVFEIDLPIDREVDDNLHVGFRRAF